jgi:predicted nucleic acid-binding protein
VNDTIVVDASVLAPALVDDTDVGHAYRTRLRGYVLTAPELMDVEVLSIVRKLVHRREVTDQRAAQALADLADLPLERFPHAGLIRRAWELHPNVTAYDGMYVVLAEALNAPLLTADGRLAQAPGPRCVIEVLSKT